MAKSCRRSSQDAALRYPHIYVMSRYSSVGWFAAQLLPNSRRRNHSRRLLAKISAFDRYV